MAFTRSLVNLLQDIRDMEAQLRELSHVLKRDDTTLGTAQDIIGNINTIATNMTAQ